jgi:tol-pal system protein YbgF
MPIRLRQGRYGAILGLVAVLAGCLSVPPEEDPVYLKQVEISNRLARVERLLDNQGLLNLQNELAGQQKETQALRNEVETLRHDLDQATERQRQQYLDLDQRLQGRMAAAVGASATGASVDSPAVSNATPASGGADRASYQAAFELLKQGNYAEAAGGFRQFLAKYPGSGLADNAQYWLGESYYVAQKFKEALPEFELVVSKYPGSRKLPDAMLKIGYCNDELKRWDVARRMLSNVAQNFAGTTAARLASQRLEAMTRDGH